jgi:hypothetical protein
MVETASPFLHQEIEAAAVLVGKKNRLASVTAENDVVESTGEMNARFTCHVGKIAESVNLSTSKPDPIFPILSVLQNLKSPFMGLGTLKGWSAIL